MSEPRFTPAPWVWHTSNSWKRLKRECRGLSMTVLEPFVHWRDQHPDCTITEEDMALIAAAPDMYRLIADFRETAAALLEGDTAEAWISDCDQILAKARGESA